MAIIIEPKGVDFTVERVKRTKEDIELVSKAIAHYKATGEKMRAPTPKSKNKSINRSKKHSKNLAIIVS